MLQGKHFKSTRYLLYWTHWRVELGQELVQIRKVDKLIQEGHDGLPGGVGGEVSILMVRGLLLSTPLLLFSQGLTLTTTRQTGADENAHEPASSVAPREQW